MGKPYDLVWNDLARKFANSIAAEGKVNQRRHYVCYGEPEAGHLWILVASHDSETAPQSLWSSVILWGQLESGALASVVGFALSDDGRAWAMVIDPDPAKAARRDWGGRLTMLHERAWQQACRERMRKQQTAAPITVETTETNDTATEEATRSALARPTPANGGSSHAAPPPSPHLARPLGAAAGPAVLRRVRSRDRPLCSCGPGRRTAADGSRPEPDR